MPPATTHAYNGDDAEDADPHLIASHRGALDESDLHLSYAPPAFSPSQYGPLTAQGNYMSSMDAPMLSSWTSAASMPAAAFLDATLPADSYGMLDFASPSLAYPWSEPAGSLVPNAEYGVVYGQQQLSQASDAAAYQGMGAGVGGPIYDQDALPALDSSISSNDPSPLSSNSPYQGIWAYNPGNVDVNFVYPTPDDRTAPYHIETQKQPSVVVESKVSPTVSNEEAAAQKDISPGGKAKSLRPMHVKKNKTEQLQLTAPRRNGPLSLEQRQKADDMRYYGACWRCRRYKKPCNWPGTCNTCETSGFRIWPSTIGCYRGNMEDFIVGVMPGNAEQVINGMSFTYNKSPNWKSLFGYSGDFTPILYDSGPKDKWSSLSVKLQMTRMAGRGFVELLEILANYQRSRSKPDQCLELACSALSHICDIYHAFVITDTNITLDPPAILAALTSFRSTYSANWRQFLSLCLSGKRSAWFPAFLCACINVPLLVVLKDSFVAIPEPARTSLWPNIAFLIEDLRNRLYPMGLDLLSALAKGIKPWKLKCWDWVERPDPSDPTGENTLLERDPEGLKLLGGDAGAFDGFHAIQRWLERNRGAMLDGASFLTTPPFSQRNANMQPIAALAWIFEVKRPDDDGEVQQQMQMQHQRQAQIAEAPAAVVVGEKKSGTSGASSPSTTTSTSTTTPRSGAASTPATEVGQPAGSAGGGDTGGGTASGPASAAASAGIAAVPASSLPSSTPVPVRSRPPTPVAVA